MLVIKYMDAPKKGRLEDIKTLSSTIFTNKPNGTLSTRQVSKDVSPKKMAPKTKFKTETKTNSLTEGIELAISNTLKKTNQRWSQEKTLPAIKTSRDSQKKVAPRPAFGYSKKRSKVEEGVDAAERNKFREKDAPDQERKRKFKSLDAVRQVDDEQGDLIVYAHDNIGNRYEVISAIGRGTFGQVFRVYDHKGKEYVALKVIKNDQKFTTQARVQVKLLRSIREKDAESKSNVIEIKDAFIYKNHMCIAFEILHISLYDFLKEHDFSGFSLDLIRRIAIQVLQSLLFLEKHEIVHCDLKPENILLKQANKSGIKVIDLGSGCHIHERIYNYIQSRFYRAPEIILGIPYTCAIDMWSFGCILAELSSGVALFPGSSEIEQMDRFVEILGEPPEELLNISPRKKKFYDDDIFRGKRKPNSKKLEVMVGTEDKDFIELIRQCLEWDPEERIRPAKALLSKWIVESLPEEIRQHHVDQIKSDYPDLFH